MQDPAIVQQVQECAVVVTNKGLLHIPSSARSEYVPGMSFLDLKIQSSGLNVQLFLPLSLHLCVLRLSRACLPVILNFLLLPAHSAQLTRAHQVCAPRTQPCVPPPCPSFCCLLIAHNSRACAYPLCHFCSQPAGCVPPP